MDGAVYEIWQFSEKILSKAARGDSFGLFKYIKEEKKMFRPMRRSKQALSAQETKALLSAEKRGILAVNGDEATPSRFLSIIIMMTRREKFLSMAARQGIRWMR